MAQGAILLICLALLLYTTIPHLSNRYILPKLLKQLPFSRQSLQIESLSPWKMVAQLDLAEQGSSAALPRLELHYNLRSLFHGKFEQILCDGLVIRLQLKNGTLHLPPSFSGKESPKKDPQRQPPSLPITAKNFFLRNCTLLIEDSQTATRTTLLVDGELATTTAPSSRKINRIKGNLRLRGDIAATSLFSGDFSKQNPVITIQLTLPTLVDFQPFLPSPLKLFGQGTMEAALHFDPAYDLQRYQLALQFPGTTLRYTTMQIHSPQQSPLRAVFTGNREKTHIALHNLHLAAPQKLNAEMTGELSVNGNFNGIADIYTPYSTAPLKLHLLSGKKNDGTHITAELTGKDLQHGDISLPGFTLQTTAQIKKGRTAGNLRLDIPHIIHPQIRLAKGHLDLPFQFPFEKTRPGKLSISSIRCQKKDIGQLRAELAQTTDGIKTDLLLTTPLLKKSRLTCKTELRQSPFIVTAQCHLPWAEFDSERFPPELKNTLEPSLHLTGKIGAKSDITFAAGKMSGSAKLAIADGSAIQKDIALTGIHAAVSLPDINRIQSAQDQRITIEKLTFGDIEASKAKIRWRLENPTSLFIESARLAWCDGTVETASLRLSPAQPDLETTLYCDRLRLSKLFSQLGVAEADGQVTLNGRLPVILSDKGIHIDNGFLFSTPGEKGVLNFTNTRQISNSIPAIKSSPYVAYSLDSLKNFAYNWVKLLFNSEKGDLLMQMQLDGKPAKPLPYAYSSGTIIHSTEGPGLQHPVHLEVNFRLPLQQMFEYRAGFQSLMKNLKESL